ncbi:hypothetical protein D3C85_1577370 [compost metagenome]
MQRAFVWNLCWLVIVGAIEKQADRQAMSASGGAWATLSGIQPLTVGLLLGQLLAMVGTYCACIARQAPRQRKCRRYMGPCVGTHFGHTAGSCISRGSLIGFLGEG